MTSPAEADMEQILPAELAALGCQASIEAKIGPDERAAEADFRTRAQRGQGRNARGLELLEKARGGNLGKSEHAP
ncbi:hypothetical protein Thiowin_03053 [Thiorhodovibrio winogradskyi]|uniref:Uncharacterized protein n=1 Tax=Thiorhodovibrio winogradskyi TaxID=77007 RepID=A0ABZ0SAF3_9GAMM|nr:hypothetical protein [Thiorhodovibrio winogradskyi]